MDPAARLAEIGAILAIALLRLRRQQSKRTLALGDECTGLHTCRKRACVRAETEKDRAMSESVLAEIAALEGKSLPELRKLWQELFDRDPPPLGRRYLQDRLAFRVQELRLGGLPDRARRRLDALADQIEPKAARKREPARLLPGTQLQRTWQGVEHVATVRDDGFEYDGRPYKSLSAIARAITNVRWNGPLFFGLRPSGKNR